MAVAIAIGVVIGVLTLLSLSTGGAAREGSYRRGTGWYLDTKTPRDTLMGRRFAIPSRRPLPSWSIRLWAASGVASLITAVVILVVVRSVAATVLFAALGVLMLGLAFDAMVHRKSRVLPDQSSRVQPLMDKAGRAEEKARKLVEKGNIEAAQEVLASVAAELRDLALGSGNPATVLKRAEELKSLAAAMTKKRSV